MEGRSPEFLPIEKEVQDAGFSEKRAARLLEGAHQDNSQVKKRKPVASSSVKKIRRLLVLRKRQNPSKKITSRRDKI